ncbi:MAG TPA: RDD family protein [Cytophagales bacterium]|nr:RDD family protein [Cytophagales bacterium]
MQKIEINTTQNVTIQYDLATLTDRFLAFLLDAVIIFGSVLLIVAFTAPFLGNDFKYVAFFILYPIFFFYNVAFEILNDGQSLGKKAMQIRVVKITGKAPELSDYLIRWVFRAIDIYGSFGSIAAIFISSSTKNQRLGDLLAQTTVIKVKPAMNLNLEDILKISSRDDYSPQYPEVKKLQEEDLILVKNVIERARKYANPAHEMAVQETADNLRSRLEIPNLPQNNIEFLKTLIKDYIVLTR